MIVGSLSALLGGFMEVPDNFYGWNVQDCTNASKGVLSVFTTMCYCLLQQNNPINIHALNAWYRLKHLITDPKQNPTSNEEFSENENVNELAEQSLTTDVIKELVQTTFSACVEPEFMLQQLVPDPNLNVQDLTENHKSLIGICNSLLGDILGEGLNVEQKRNALRYLFVKYGFFTQR